MSRKCKQCGEVKAISNYRQYYNGGESHYRVCKECEKVNSRFKYLSKKDELLGMEEDELAIIKQLYELQRANGFSPPQPKTITKANVAQAMLEKLAKSEEELVKWLNMELSGYTPEELEKTYEYLKDKYRPRIGINNETFLPIYDDTYQVLLSKILVRFDDYEEDYYGMEHS